VGDQQGWIERAGRGAGAPVAPPPSAWARELKPRRTPIQICALKTFPDILSFPPERAFLTFRRRSSEAVLAVKWRNRATSAPRLGQRRSHFGFPGLRRPIRPQRAASFRRRSATPAACSGLGHR